MPETTNPKPVNMGLQLFPPPPRNKTTPTRKPSTRRNVVTPQDEKSTSMDGRQSSMDGRQSSMGNNGQETPQTGRDTPQNGRSTPQQNGRETPPHGRNTPQQNGLETPQHSQRAPQPDLSSPIQAPPTAHIISDLPPRSHTSFSEAPTLIRKNSNESHRSATRFGLSNGSPPRDEPVMRSIFPRYNPEIALEHQAYYPTQASPTHIPSAIINRRPYSPSINDRSPFQSPSAMGAAPGRFPRGVQDEAILEPSSNDDMKDLWKVVNGWRVSSSEGRTFCLKMTSSVDEPIHTLSSATQPLYTLRLMPTSTSAQMTMMRHDPNKSPKGPNSPRLGSSSKSKEMEVMSTTLEETARRLPPNDGLVALLYPRAASDMVIELANKPGRSDGEQIVAAAERECGRLVWDEDSGKYYLVHPAMSTPFVVTITSSPAWSRVEYTLEHSELPRNLVRLVRDGAGSGFLEIDTAVAARIDCFYIVDVAICAIMLVTVAEEKNRNVERFAGPPSIAPTSPDPSKRHSSTWTIGKAKSKGKKEAKIEEFEMDLESQDSLKGKRQKTKDSEEKVPGFFGLIWMMIKCFVWTLTMFVKGIAKVIIFVSSCLTRKKK